MIKVSAQRSIMRRMALTKAADDYAALLRGYANAHRPGLVAGGVRVAVNDNLRKSRAPGQTQPPAATNTAPASATAPAGRPVARR